MLLYVHVLPLMQLPQVPLLLGLLPPSLQTSHVPLMRDIDLAHAILGSSPSRATSYDRVSYSPSLRISNTADTDMAFRDYHPLAVIQTWMCLVSSYYSTHVRLISIGTSYEGRDIPAFRIGVHPKNNEKPSGPRKTVIISGGTHAREWISTSTVNYIAYSLMTSYGKSRTVTSLVEAFDWIFIPTLNPDGYVYTWETDRLWRKNRQPTKLSFCRGVDLDRAWSFHWDGESSRGNPCSESFAGEAPFEGDEARQFADWAKNETEHNNAKIVGFLDLHSYSQQVLYPYSYSCDAAPPTLENLEELALGLAKAMRLSRGGHNYKATSACEGNVNIERDGRKTVLPRMETGGGSALDWFYHEMRVEYTYQIKLRDTGSYGFLLPKENIVPTGKEVLEAVLYLGKHLLDDAGSQSADKGVAKNQQDVPAASRSEVAGGNDGQASEQSPDDEETRDSSGDFAVEGMQWELKRRKR